MSKRYQGFHQKGRWQGLPLRVEDSDETPRFEPVLPHATQDSGLRAQDSPEKSDPGTRNSPDRLMLGVPNQGMMAGQPTNVLLLGYVVDESRSLTLVDTGSAEGYPVLEQALGEAQIAVERIGQIVLTHCHPDHIGNARAIREASGAAVWAHPAEREQIERWGQGIEIDHWIEPDQQIECDGFRLETIFTPGHSPGHSCVVEPISRALIAGDMISGFGSVGVFPPSGSMAAYIDSLQRLLTAHEDDPFSLVCPGHGPLIDDAGAKIAEYIEHRLQREEEVFAAIASGKDAIDALLTAIYPDVQPHLARAARSTLLAHLDKLGTEGRVVKIGEDRYAVV